MTNLLFYFVLPDHNSGELNLLLIKKTAILFCLLALPLLIMAQTLNQTVIGSSGEVLNTADGRSLSFTLGEIAVETYRSNNNKLTQGFHQLFPVNIEEPPPQTVLTFYIDEMTTSPRQVVEVPVKVKNFLTILKNGNPQLELSDRNGSYKLWGGLNFHIQDKNNKNRFYISSAGKVGIGTISPARKLSVPSGGISTDAFYTSNKNGQTRVLTFTDSKNAGVIYGYGANGKLNFFLGKKESSRPNDGQLILYGTTGKSNGTSGGISKYPVRMYSYNNKGYIRADNIGQWSDRRIKKDIITLENGLEKVLQLRGVQYNMKEDSTTSATNPKEIGLIAQEVEEITPELVEQEDDGLRSVNYAKMVAVLIEAIKDQQAIINEQLVTIHELQTSTQNIEARLLVLEKRELEEKIIETTKK